MNYYKCIVLEDDCGNFNGIQIVGHNDNNFSRSLYHVFSITLKTIDGELPILSGSDSGRIFNERLTFDSAVVAMFCYINQFNGFCYEDAIKGFNQSNLMSFLFNFNCNQTINVPSTFQCKDVDIHIEKIKRLLKRVVVGISPEAALAFLRGTHARLGANSLLARLPKHVVRSIVTGLRPQ